MTTRSWPLRLTLAILPLFMGCAWTSRNIYREPTAGDAGTITFVKHSKKRMNVWLFPDPAKTAHVDDGKAIAVFSDLPERSVRVLHKDLITLSLELIETDYIGVGFQAHGASVAYDVPYAQGDLRVSLDEDKTGYHFIVEQRIGSGDWSPLTGLKARELGQKQPPSK